MDNLTQLDAIHRFLEQQLAAAFYDQGEAPIIARWLLEERLDLTHAQLLAYPELVVSADQRAQLKQDLTALQAGQPPQYVIGSVQFLNNKLTIEHGVFIPRPETEELAHQLTHQGGKPSGPVLDIGAGSGCLAIALASAFPEVPVQALENSERALPALRANIAQNNTSVQVIAGSILKPGALPVSLEPTFALIVSNPPYVTQQEQKQMAERITGHEPAEALYVPDADPLKYYRAIAHFAAAYLCGNGQLALEVNAAYAQQVASLLQQQGFADVSVMPDLQGADRFVYAFQPNQ